VYLYAQQAVAQRTRTRGMSGQLIVGGNAKSSFEIAGTERRRRFTAVTASFNSAICTAVKGTTHS